MDEASTKSSKKEKKEKKEKGKKEAQAAPIEAEPGPKDDATVLATHVPTVSPPPLATGAEREKELLEIREILASRKKGPPSKPHR